MNTTPEAPAALPEHERLALRAERMCRLLEANDTVPTMRVIEFLHNVMVYLRTPDLCRQAPVDIDAQVTWPNVRIKLERGKLVSGFQYAPGLPDGEHDMWCVPVVSGATPKAQRAEGWMPVSERLPDHAGYVLAWNGRALGLAQHAQGSWWHILQVTHWMPLPSPPLAAAQPPKEP